MVSNINGVQAWNRAIIHYITITINISVIPIWSPLSSKSPLDCALRLSLSQPLSELSGRVLSVDGSFGSFLIRY